MKHKNLIFALLFALLMTALAPAQKAVSLDDKQDARAELYHHQATTLESSLAFICKDIERTLSIPNVAEAVGQLKELNESVVRTIKWVKDEKEKKAIIMHYERAVFSLFNVFTLAKPLVEELHGAYVANENEFRETLVKNPHFVQDFKLGEQLKAKKLIEGKLFVMGLPTDDLRSQQPYKRCAEIDQQTKGFVSLDQLLKLLETGFYYNGPKGGELESALRKYLQIRLAESD